MMKRIGGGARRKRKKGKKKAQEAAVASTPNGPADAVGQAAPGPSCPARSGSSSRA